MGRRYFLHLTDDDDESKIVSYVIVYYTDDTKNFMMIDCLQDATEWSTKNKNNYEYVSQVYNLNMSSYNIFMGKN